MIFDGVKWVSSEVQRSGPQGFNNTASRRRYLDLLIEEFLQVQFPDHSESIYRVLG